MAKQEVFDYVEERYEVAPDYPWNDGDAVLRHLKSRKWFALVMTIDGTKLGLVDAGQVEILNVKCDPFLIGSLRLENGFHPAYHMNKDKWLTIRLDGSVPLGEIKKLIDLSFELTLGKTFTQRL